MLKAHGVERVHAVRGMKSLAVRMPDGTVFLDESLGAGSTGTALHELVHKWKREGNQKVKRIENAFQRSTAAAKRFILKLADSVESAIGNRADAVEYAEKHAAEEATAIVLDLMAKRGGKSALGLEKSDILAAFGGMAKQVENMARALADKAQAAKRAYLDGKAAQAAPEEPAARVNPLLEPERVAQPAADVEVAPRPAEQVAAPEAARAAEPPRPAEPVKAEGVDSDGYVLDKKGKRATVLHGSHKATVAFEDGKTAFFTDNDFVAKGYTWTRGIGRRPSAEGSVTKAQLVMKKPLVIDANGKRNDNIPVPWKEWKPKVFGNLPPDAVSVEDAAEYAKQNGYDGVIIRNVIDSADVDDRTKSTVYAVFSPSQIKTGEGEAPRAAEPQAAPRAAPESTLASRYTPEQLSEMKAHQEKMLDTMKGEPREAKAQDAEYLAAVKRGDMETAQRMVDEAAKAAGYNVGPVYHGTRTDFNIPRTRGISAFDEKLANVRGDNDAGMFFSNVRDTARDFAQRGRRGDHRLTVGEINNDVWPEGARIVDAYLKLDNPKEFDGVGDFISYRSKNFNRIQDALREEGYDGIVLRDASYDASNPDETWYIATDPSQIKSAEAVVRDDTGRIIPPSERFNPQRDDIRYAARPPAASEWDGAKVERYKRKDGAVRFKVVVDGKSRRAGFGSAENAERYLTEQKARLEDDYAAVIRRTKASVADIAEARRKLTIELSNEKAVAADVVNSLFKAMTRLDIMTPVHRKEIAAEIKRTAQERKADPEGWAKRTTEKVWQIASRISYMKELNDIFDKKQPVVTENKTLQAKPKYDAFVNRWIAKAKEYAELTPEEVNQRIEAIDADQNNRLANRGEEMAEELDDSVRERHLLSTFGGLFHGADYARAKAAFEAAKDLVTEGRERFMEMENHRKMQAAAKRQQIIEEAKGGRQIDGNELEMETRNKSIWELLSSAGNWLHSKVLSGPYLYNQAADTRKGVDDMSGEAVRQYEGEVRAIEDEERLNEIVREDLTGIMADAMGLADPAKNRAEAAKFSKILHGWRKKQKATGIFLHRAVRNARGDLIRIEQGSELRNSQTKLLTMFLIAKRAESAAKQRFTNEPVEIEGGFNSIMEALVHNGYTAETIAQIEKNLDPRLIKIGWKMLEYMRDHSRPEVEKATFRLLGAVPPMYGEWYFPMDRANDKRNVAGGRNAYTLVQGFMKMLTPNKLDFRPVDAFERFLSHFDDLNHVVSHIEIVDQQNRIFNHPDMQKTLRVYRGDAMRKAVNNHLDRLTLGGEAGMAASVLRWFRSMFARSVIPNPTQTPKQMSSMILFSTRELPPGANLMDWFLGVGKAIASPRDALRFDAELNKYCVRWRERYGHGYNQQVREARRGATARDLLGKKMAWFEFMNAFPQAGDKISSLIGGRPIYDLWYKHFTEVEKNPPMVAREKAMRKFMDAVELTQQSGALPHLSDSQVGFAANFMMFKTQPTAMTRLWMNSVRNLAMKRGSVRDNVWNMVAVMIGQMAFQAAADAFFVAAFDDPDEWKRLRHNQVRAALFAPINGYLVLPEALLRLTKIAMKDKVYGEFAGDVSSYLDVVNDIENVVKMFMKEEEMDGNDWMDVAQGVGSIGGAFTGKPIAPTVRWGRGIYDAVTDPTLSTPGRIARGVGYGKQAAGQDKPRKTSASSSPYPWESPAARSPYAKMPWER